MNELILEVTELNRYVNRVLQSDALVSSCRLRGEISGFKAYPSGHWYFTIKDSSCSIRGVMFRGSAMRMSFRPKDGDKVLMHGAVKVYEENGTYQFVADSMRLDGIGDLYHQFEQLKRKLQGEGLFDPGRKRPLPARPRKIAVVTSEAGAVLHDIRKVSAARDPGVPLVLLPVPVQGDGAAEKIAEAVRTAGTLPMVDVIIVGRGGGSMEDLWEFNEETVARAIFTSPVPVISAVGHETDFTIADFVADVRASTPSNAAELAVPDRAELTAALELMRRRFTHAVESSLQASGVSLMQLHQRMTQAGPEQKIGDALRRIAVLRASLERMTADGLSKLQPRVAMAQIRLDNAVDTAIEHNSALLEKARASLNAVSPVRVLERGYALVTANGHAITSSSSAPEHMVLHFSDGRVSVTRDKE